MILPVIGYGDPVLRKLCNDISSEYPGLKYLVQNMYDTMYNAFGVGLAAPQVGLAIRLFIIDTSPFSEDEALKKEDQEKLKGFKKVFINARMIREEGEEWGFNEGCLSIPDVREDVFRKERIKIEYFDEDFKKQVEVYDGLIARVIQHEYDHIEGVLFTDKISTLKRRLNQKKIQNIIDGKVCPDYKMRFFAKKGR